MASSRPKRNGTQGQTRDTPLTQPPPTPRRGIRFQAVVSTEIPSNNYGHFPSAPETYPIDVPDTVFLAEQPPVPEYPSHSTPNLIFSLYSPPSVSSNKRASNSTQLEVTAAPKKRQKKATATTSDAESLHGIAPPVLMEHPTSIPRESAPAYYGSVLRADPAALKKSHPTLWSHICRLTEKEPAQSVLDSVSNDPILKAKPSDSTYVGCRPCLTATR